jgi:hypothetical protein
MKYELTQDDIDNYISGKTDACPFCGSVDIEGSSWDYDGDWTSQEVTCLECGGCWKDIYSLCDMIVVYPPDKDVKDGDSTVHG